MAETDVLIVGQGLAGTWLSWWLKTAGLDFYVIDEGNKNSASVKAAGLINPVTGRRMVKTWMIDELIPFALKSYSEIGNFLNTRFVESVSVLDFFPSAQMLDAFRKRIAENADYLNEGEDAEAFADLFRYDFGWGAIQSCLLIGVENLLQRWRAWLRGNDKIIESRYDVEKLQSDSNGIQYEHIHARYIIFCDGISSAENPLFDRLPFAPNKGEALLVQIDGLPTDKVYKKGMSLVPVKDNLFWLGSSYEWIFDNNKPTNDFRVKAESWLSHFLKLPYNILEHFAAIRPATLERRPFVGFHPLHSRIGLLNGLGTKGCSLAPYFAKQLADKILGKSEIDPLADIQRFKRILSIGS